MDLQPGVELHRVLIDIDRKCKDLNADLDGIKAELDRIEKILDEKISSENPDENADPCPGKIEKIR